MLQEQPTYQECACASPPEGHLDLSDILELGDPAVERGLARTPL